MTLKDYNKTIKTIIKNMREFAEFKTEESFRAMVCLIGVDLLNQLKKIEDIEHLRECLIAYMNGELKE